MPGRVTRCGKKLDIIREYGVRLYQARASQLDQRQGAVRPDSARQLPALPCLALPVFILRAANVVGGLLKGGYPAALHQPRVPAAMVNVQVGVDDTVHIFEREGLAAEPVQPGLLGIAEM